MSGRQYISGRMKDGPARTTVRLAYEHRAGSKALGDPKTLAEMEALGVRKALRLILRCRRDADQPFGNLAGWILVAADIAAVLHRNVQFIHVESQCAVIGLPIDTGLIDMAARRVAAARNAEGGEFRMMSAEAIGKLIELTSEEREGLGITKIGAVDESPDDRRRRLDRDRKRQSRADRGIKPRAALPGIKPWDAQGISRTKYYAQQSNLGLNVLGSIKNGKADFQSQIPGKADTESDICADFQSQVPSPSGKADAQSSETVK